jgi:hypothetical protein
MIASAPDLKEFLQRVFEAFLVAVGRDRGLGVGTGHQRLDPALADALCLGRGRHLGLPGLILPAGVAASHRARSKRHRNQQGGSGQSGQKAHVGHLLLCLAAVY